ncbi:MAG TPA: hypothetical protein VMC84_04790 [Methanocella sp.]|uniref:hypothetical protein n=1 Tax=Methanocella sp. TaxID=2052833 RepID=UPI002BC27ED7|nr:hypothetical protein [Methanocella sp.]HTY90474.1 hypothetical protein [Methanocella sp.]
MPGIPIKRNDIVTGDDILNMTTEQRKGLGINKSTLWYIQKTPRACEKVKIYDKER